MAPSAKTKTPRSGSAKSGSTTTSKSGGSSSRKNSPAVPPVEEVGLVSISDISATGVQRRNTSVLDIHMDNFSVTFRGKEIVKDTVLELIHGRRYGLIGANGSGKSIMLKAIGDREVPIPSHMDLFHLTAEVEASDESALTAVLNVDQERVLLEKEAEKLAESIGADTPEDVHQRIQDIYDHLETLHAATAEARAAKILSGLGFSAKMQQKKTRDFSGGWRMRIALARALFLQPTILLLDEPTNHLDVEAVVWLGEYIKTWNPKGIMILVSHSQDFLNEVCTNIISLNKRLLTYYTGNYDQYVQTRCEREENQMKMFKWQQDQMAHMKDFIARFGHGSRKMARQAQSREKVLAKMTRDGLAEKVVADHVLTFRFNDPEPLSPPVLVCSNISFAYPNSATLYEDVDFGVDLDSRIALVGPNGAGKSTLLKLMIGELTPTQGMVRHHCKLRIGRFNQHFVDQLDLNLSPLGYMLSCFQDMEQERMRAFLGRFDLTGTLQTQPMRTLSDGQKSRVVLAWLAFKDPHILLLDEPTNHLDMESIDALALAINEFEGGVVLVSHDMRLISQVAEEIWICDEKKVTRYAGDLNTYKQMLIKRMRKQDLLDK